ncbi:YeiH family protein [Pseudonocardia sp. N23]|uniref:YeiH family protein n=1 Tax=Pseudonocardia sp. N23 TaxID=1987376 RepID=UPI000BFE6638|nr:YeiH family protein [Pseudonocardia sp. N23]GAY09959.1 putative membrane protein YeiH [Pseudonocardia sp. N23]
MTGWVHGSGHGWAWSRPAWVETGTRRGRRTAPGLAVAVAIAVVATALGRLVPVVGGPVFAIVLGAAAGVLLKPGERLVPGIDVAAKPVLQLSIVVLGTGLSLQQVVQVGAGSLPVMLGTLAVALVGGWLLGRALGVGGGTRILISVGTGICGASAIAATTAVIDAKRHEIAYALGTIFVFNVIAVLTFPALGHLMGLSDQAFGLWAGTAVNDTSSVVASAVAYGGDASGYAIVVKLTRTLLLVPIVLALAVWTAKRAARSEPGSERGLRDVPWRRVVPLFLIGFLAAATLDTLGLVPDAWHPALSLLGTFLITVALAGVGLTLRPTEIRGAGPRPLLLGGLLWVAVAATSLGLQALTGTL